MKPSDMTDTSKDHFNWYIETILKGRKDRSKKTSKEAIIQGTGNSGLDYYRSRQNLYT